MIPCLLCSNGSNAKFDGWDIVAEGGLEVLCARYVCKSCGTPMWVQMAIRQADEYEGEDEGDDAPADMSAGWEI